MKIKKGFFTVPTDVDTPVICVGPGTGIAPARAIVEERIALGARGQFRLDMRCQHDSSIYLGPSAYPTDNVLYQGCRSATKDQHYKDEFLAFVSQESSTAPAVEAKDSANGVKPKQKANGVVRYDTGAKLSYRVACSRDGPPGVKRTYVQDLILEDGEKVWEAIGHRDGYLYISG